MLPTSLLQGRGMTEESVWGIGVAVAIEALREVRRNKVVSMDSLLETAKVGRATRIMRPSMEALA